MSWTSQSCLCSGIVSSFFLFWTSWSYWGFHELGQTGVSLINQQILLDGRELQDTMQLRAAGLKENSMLKLISKSAPSRYIPCPFSKRSDYSQLNFWHYSELVYIYLVCFCWTSVWNMCQIWRHIYFLMSTSLMGIRIVWILDLISTVLWVLNFGFDIWEISIQIPIPGIRSIRLFPSVISLVSNFYSWFICEGALHSESWVMHSAGWSNASNWSINPDGSATNPIALQKQLRGDTVAMAQLQQVGYSMSPWCVHPL